MNDNPYEERDRTGFHEGMDPKAIAYNVSLDMATLLVGHMDGYCLSSDNPFAPWTTTHPSTQEQLLSELIST